MRLTTIHLVGLFVLASCQTPAPPQKETFDDEVIVKDKRPDPPPDEPDAGPDPLPDMATVEQNSKPGPEVTPPETFVAKPELPPNMSFQETALARTAAQMKQGLIFAPILDAGCGIPTAIRAAADSRGAGYTVDSCSRAVDAAHALSYQRTLTNIGVLDVSAVAIKHDGQALWSASSDCTNLRQDDKACASDFIVRHPTTMSFVGPLLSYHMESRVAVGGAAATTENLAYVVDVRTGMPAKFGALIDEDSLVNGLKRDLFMRKTLNPKELDAAKSLDAIWKLWRTQDFAFFGAYYFAAWDAENGLAEMRIWYLEDAASMAPNELKEFAIWVIPKAQWKAAFEEAASEKSGFLAP